MSTREIARIPMNRHGYNTRAAQSIQQFGTGAMVDFPDQTLMAAAPIFWKNSVTEIHDERLENALDVKYIGMPGTDSGNIATKEGISYVRFPEWYFCPVCRRFQPLKQWISEHEKYAPDTAKNKDAYMVQHLKCYKDNCQLVASNIVTVCENGHIDDFPWIAWAHFKNARGSKGICADPKLTFRTGNSAAEGLRGLEVHCETCKSLAVLTDAFDPSVFEKLIEEKSLDDFRCRGYHPWKGTRCACNKYPVTKQRGDASVYFSTTASSIVIPANVDANYNKVSESLAYKKVMTILNDCDTEEERDDMIDRRFDKWAVNIAEQTRISLTTVKRILTTLLTSNGDIGLTKHAVDSVEYKFEEYCALSGINKVVGSEDFMTEEMDISKYDIPGVSQVVLVKKLKEVQAHIGFSRLHPVSASDTENPSLVSIKDSEEDWYPGYEVRGEGIFFQFDMNVLNKWSNEDFTVKRKEILLYNYEHSTMKGRIHENIDAIYMFLHTLSHLLIKQLSYECGYNIASLRERIYYMPEKDEDTKMAGILIYTASGDSEGTLGGLVRQGREDSFPRIFKEAVEHARLCSNDPVCITSKGQGRESLNLSACHACALIPETSCESYNIMLDRALVVGTFEEPMAGFFSEWINE